MLITERMRYLRCKLNNIEDLHSNKLNALIIMEVLTGQCKVSMKTFVYYTWKIVSWLLSATRVTNNNSLTKQHYHITTT